MSRAAGSGGMVCMLNVLLKSIIRSSNDRLNVCHINAGAISPKIDEFRYVFSGVELVWLQKRCGFRNMVQKLSVQRISEIGNL